MNDLKLIIASLKSRWLNCSLSIALTAFGVMLALLVIQFGSHIQNRLVTDGQGIDIVVGSKGSPLQLILSSVYHVDIPTGNIPYEEALKWSKHPHIRDSIPLALGDNWKGYRIVGTTHDYVTHYNAELTDGRLWDKVYEAVAGSNTGLKLGDTFSGAHGFAEDGHVHADESYTVVGLVEPTGTVLDRLILTSVNSVLDVHGQQTISGHGDKDDHHDEHEHHEEDDHHDEHEHHEEDDHHDEHEHHEEDDHHDEHEHHEEDDHHDEHEHHEEDDHHDEHEHHEEDDHHDEHEHNDDHDHHHEAGDPEITAILLKTRSPVANLNLPRVINRDSDLQAANPAYEIARLSNIFGLGMQTISSFSIILIIIAALSIFAGLSGNFENRMKDHAVLRALGYKRMRLARMISAEALIITGLGVLLGFAGSYFIFNSLVDSVDALSASGAVYSLNSTSFLLAGTILVVGFLAALFPAIKSARIDISKQLGKTL